MSEADKMFKELGYKLKDTQICPHSFCYIKIKKTYIKEIVLEKVTKRITICYYKEEVDGTIRCINDIEYTLDIKELQAINEKFKEEI